MNLAMRIRKQCGKYLCNPTKALQVSIFATIFVGAPHAQALTYSGFASLGAGKLDQEEFTFLDDNDRWSFDSDSIIGLQVQQPISEYWRFTTQVVSRGYHSNNRDDYQPEFEWLYLTYQGSSDLRFRGGKLRTPLFLHSEDLEVGYAYPWVRPPTAVYALAVTPFSNYEGGDITYFSQVGDIEIESQVFGGTHSEKYLGTDITGHIISGAVIQLHGESWKARATLANAKASYSNPQLNQLRMGLDYIAKLEPAFTHLSNRFTLDKKWLSYYTIGAEWDANEWTITTEGNYISGPNAGLSTTTAGGYLSVARQFDRWQPYAVVSRFHSHLNKSAIDEFYDTYQSAPENAGPPLIDLVRNGALQAIGRLNIAESIFAVGVRYEIYTKMALKGQIDHYLLGKESPGQFTAEGDPPYPGQGNLYTVTLDMVF